MKNYKPKLINFNEEMERDLDDVKSKFQKNFGLTPSNTDIIHILMKTFKEVEMQRKPKSKRDLIIRL